MGINIAASDLAKYLIRYFFNKNQPISNLKLQKLLYYCQGWHLGIAGSPLFRERIEAWVHGPVVPSIFQEYRQYRWSPIAVNAEPPSLRGKPQEIVDAVLEGYGALSASQLEQLSHAEDPWKEARQGLPSDCPCTTEITHESMKRYFAQLASG